MDFRPQVYDFDSKIKDLRKLSTKLNSLKTNFSILDEIQFRFAIATNLWRFGGERQIDEAQLKKLPKDLTKVLRIYQELSNHLDVFFVSIRNSGDESIRAYLGLRKRELDVATKIYSGLLGPAVESMKSIVSVLKSHLESRGKYPSGQFKEFWNSYVKAKSYFEEVFIIFFPDEYDPRIEPEYSAALKKSLSLEEACLDAALSSQLVSALEHVSEWRKFMEKFIERKQNLNLRPTKVV